MVKYINPVAQGLAIGQGEAQVFDTTGLMKWSIEQKDKARLEAKKDKEKKEKALLDSLVEMDTSKLWDRDLGMYNEKWGKYNNFVKENYTALQNPANNIEVYQEKRKMEQEMLQFVTSSGDSEKIDIEIQKMLLKDESGELQDVDGLYAAWKKDPGNMANALEYIQRIKKIEPLTDLITDYKKSGGMPLDKNYNVPDGKGGTVSQEGTSPEGYKSFMSQNYQQNEDVQNSANKAWEEAGGAADSGFDNPEDFYMSEIMKQYDKPFYKETEKGTGDKWTFGSGWGKYGKVKMTGGFINQGPDIKTQPGERNILFRKEGKNFAYQEMDLTDAQGNQETTNVAIQDVVEKGTDKYVLRVRVPSMSQTQYKDKKTEILNKHGGKIELMVPDVLSKYNADIEALEKKMNEGSKIKEYPLSETVNIQQLNSTLGTDDFYSTIPKLLSTKIEGFKPKAY